MNTADNIENRVSPAVLEHVHNVAQNLQLVADLGYGDVVLLVPDETGQLEIVADVRPMTAAAAVLVSRVGGTVDRNEEPEAYDALNLGLTVCGSRCRIRRGIEFTSTAYPVGASSSPYAVVVRYLGKSVAEAPGKMEVAFMRLAVSVLERLQRGPILDLHTGEPYFTTRLAGDGVIEVASGGTVSYASPNAVNIMRLAGAEGSLGGAPVSALPGGATAVVPVLGSTAAREITLEVAGRSLRYRTIALSEGALVLVEDVTEARRREQELRVKEVTIREVHHRVKNNLQTVASLLRIQARHSTSEEAVCALNEAVERISSMAVVHEMLAESTEESVDLAAAVRTVVDMVVRGLARSDAMIELKVEGDTGLVPAFIATSLALVVAELVHNAIEHGIGSRHTGSVTVTMRRTPNELTLSVWDDGPGLPPGFSADSSSNLGLAIVRTIVEDDMRGALSFDTGAGMLVSVRVPVTIEE